MNLLNISEIKITYHPKVKIINKPKVTGSSSAYDIIISQWHDDIHYRESFAVLLLSRANRCLGISFISKGGLAGKLLELSVLDHLIISDEAYYSFADEGLV
jgi:DNA repair protein RadC